jgi:beta-aspartyl-dipeptidase (metallo-type)
VLGLREEGVSAFAWTGGYAVPPLTLTGSVRRDIVYVDPVIGVGETAISDHRSSQPTFDEFARLAADCHVAGMMSNKAGVLHLHVGDGERGLELVRRALDATEIPPAVFHPTHVNRLPQLFEEAGELAVRGVTVDVTAFPVHKDDPALTAADAIERWLKNALPRERLTCSSDGAGCIPVFDGGGRLVSMEVGRSSALAETLAALLLRGHALEDVLPIFTSHVARHLRLARKGLVAAGADADLVALGPRGEVREVMARGRWVVRGGSPCARGTFEHGEDA